MKRFGCTILSLVLMAAATSAIALEPLGRSPGSSRRGYVRPANVEQTTITTAQEPIGTGAPVHYRQATWNIWAGTYNGYIYAPDVCDYRPPCIDHLWDGYCQHPHRCDGFHWGGRFWGCKHCGGCGLFGHGCHGGCGKGIGCGKSVGCDSCVAKVPDCGIAAKPSCGAEPSCDCGGHGWHLGHHWNGFSHKCRHFWHHKKAHWSCACGTDVGCGCGVEAKGGSYPPAPASDVPPAPLPEAEDQRASLLQDEREVRSIKLPTIGTGLRKLER